MVHSAIAGGAVLAAGSLGDAASVGAASVDVTAELQINPLEGGCGCGGARRSLDGRLVLQGTGRAAVWDLRGTLDLS